MKIGVILRDNESVLTLNKEIYEVISYYGGIAIGLTKFDKNIIDNLDGVILQGGVMYNEEDLKIVKYLYENDIPTLGICLGMQTMGVMMDGKMSFGTHENHYVLDKLKVHEIKIDTNSKFYDIIKKDKIIVNSRHHDVLTNTKLDIVGIANDAIEVIEDKNKKFFIGVQWHPETNFLNDPDSIKLFSYYFDILSK